MTELILAKQLIGSFQGRRKRFFADVELDGVPVVAHLANTGSMRSLLVPGSKAFLTKSSDPKRKLAYSLEALQLPDGTFACVNTQRPNALVALALASGAIPGIPKDSLVEREVTYKQGTRFDARVTLPDGSLLWVEVKNVTLVEPTTPGIASFPDAVTERGAKHLRDLAEIARSGVRACMFYLVNRDDAVAFRPAAWIDPTYARELTKAIEAGVEILVYRTQFSLHADALHLAVDKALPWSLA